MTREDALPIDARLVALDLTDGLILDARERAEIRHYFEVYLYDANRHVHCCELTPSYELWYVDAFLEFADGVDEARREDLWEKLVLPGPDERVRYAHVRDIERRAAAAGRDRYRVYGATGVAYADCPYEDQIEALLEHHRANAPF